MRLMSYPLRGFDATSPSTAQVTAVGFIYREDISGRCIAQVFGERTALLAH